MNEYILFIIVAGLLLIFVNIQKILARIDKINLELKTQNILLTQISKQHLLQNAETAEQTIDTGQTENVNIDINTIDTNIAFTESSKIAPNSNENLDWLDVWAEEPKAIDQSETIETNTPDLIEEYPHTPYQKPEIKPSIWETFRAKNPDLERFIGENLISKIGILIFVLGISYFVKYAIDKNWISETARVGIGVLCGAAVMYLAHKLRQQYAAFSSVLVAGAMAIFYLTIGIAFHSYGLFSQTTAFVLMVLITTFSIIISLAYNRMELAVLSLIGGFAVPFMVSTGSGNYIVLFTYIGILDVGMLVLAYFKRWTLINVLSFVFTVILYGGWLLYPNTNFPHFGALVYATAFYSIFIGMNILNNIRTKCKFSKLELSILSSNTLLYYGAGMYIIEQYIPEVGGLFTVLLGILNLLYASLLYRKFGLDKTAIYLLIGFTISFATLAIPIQFEGNQITLFWAAEAVILMWLAIKSRVKTYFFSSVIIHILVLFSLFIDINKGYSNYNSPTLILNSAFITGCFTIVSFVITYFLLKRETENQKLLNLTFVPKYYRIYCLSVVCVLIYLVGMFETIYQANTLMDNSYTANSTVNLYHLMYCLIGMQLIDRYKVTSLTNFNIYLALANVLLTTFIFSTNSFNEYDLYFTTGDSQIIGVILHYLIMISAAYIGYSIYRIKPSLFKIAKINYLAAFIIVYAASSELLLAGVWINQEEASSTISQLIKSGLPILWGLLAIIFLVNGIKYKNKTWRIIALVIFGLTVVKLFVHDIQNASETGKIVAFILLGILIMIASFVYQKIRLLIVDDGNTSQETEQIHDELDNNSETKKSDDV